MFSHFFFSHFQSCWALLLFSKQGGSRWKRYFCFRLLGWSANVTRLHWSSCQCRYLSNWLDDDVPGPAHQTGNTAQTWPLRLCCIRVLLIEDFNWRHSRSSLVWPLFFQLRPLQAWLASGAHSKAVGSTSASEGTGRFQSVKIDRTASLLKLRSTISLCSSIYWQFHLWPGKGKCEESSALGEHEKGRSGC